MSRWTLLALPLGLAPGLFACRSIPMGRAPSLVQATYRAVDELVAGATELEHSDRILVATLVDVNDVERASMLGRQVAEFLTTRLAQRGRDVVHTTVRIDSLAIRREGQFVLSRDITKLSQEHKAKAVLVGTYGATDTTVYVSLKLVRTLDLEVVSAVDYTLPHDGEVAWMLAQRGPRW